MEPSHRATGKETVWHEGAKTRNKVRLEEKHSLPPPRFIFLWFSSAKVKWQLHARAREVMESGLGFLEGRVVGDEGREVSSHRST